MPRRLRPRFPFTGYTLQCDRGLFNLTGRDATVSRTYVVPELPAGTRRIVAGSYANQQFVSTQLKKQWRTSSNATTYVAGDHLDASGVQEGTSDYARFTVTGAGAFVTLDSATYPGLVLLFNKLLDENTGIHIRKVSGSHPCAFHQGSAANPPALTLTNASGQVYTPTLLHGRGLLGYSDIRAPAFMRWNLSGVTGPIASVTLRLYVSLFYGNITLGINLLDPPFVDALPFVAVPGTSPPDLAEVDLSSAAGVAATAGTIAPPYTYNPTHFRDPDYDIDVLRAGFLTTNQRSIRWVDSITPSQEVYMGVAHKFESGMWDAQNELGLKLVSLGDSAPSGNYMYAGLEITMTRTTHDEDNRGLWGLVGYNMRNGVAQLDSGVAFCVLESERWYHLEYRVKMNTYPAADGLYEVWVNGNLVYRMENVTWVGVQQGAVDGLQWQLYHGGLGLPTQQFWVQCAKFQASTTRIGVPAEFLTAVYPAWRQNKTKDALYTISGSNLRSQVIARNLDIGLGAGTHYYGYLDAYCGVATTENAMYGLANGGHADFDGNCVWKLDFSQDSPVMSVETPESPVIPSLAEAVATTYTHYADGKPASSHSYYCQQWVPSHGRLLRIAPRSYWGNGNQGSLLVDAYDPVSKTWAAANTYPAMPSLSGTVYPVFCYARDPRNDDIYAVMGPNCRRWKADTGPVGTWESVSLASLNDQYAPMIVDPVRNRLVILSGSSLKFWDIGNRSQGVSGAGARTVVDLTSYGLTAGRFNQENALVYDPDNDRYLALHYRQLNVSNPVTEIWAINPTTYACTLLHTNEGGASELPYVGGDGQRPYNKFKYLKDYKCVVYLCNTTSDIVFMPTA